MPGPLATASTDVHPKTLYPAESMSAPKMVATTPLPTGHGEPVVRFAAALRGPFEGTSSATPDNSGSLHWPVDADTMTDATVSLVSPHWAWMVSSAGATVEPSVTEVSRNSAKENRETTTTPGNLCCRSADEMSGTSARAPEPSSAHTETSDSQVDTPSSAQSASAGPKDSPVETETMCPCETGPTALPAVAPKHALTATTQAANHIRHALVWRMYWPTRGPVLRTARRIDSYLVIR